MKEEEIYEKLKTAQSIDRLTIGDNNNNYCVIFDDGQRLEVLYDKTVRSWAGDFSTYHVLLDGKPLAFECKNVPYKDRTVHINVEVGGAWFRRQ